MLSRIRLFGNEGAENPEAGSPSRIDLTTPRNALENPESAIAQLSTALVEEQKKRQQKEEELEQMQKILAKMEKTFAEREDLSEHDQEKISKLEALLAQKQSGHDKEKEEQLTKLLLALKEIKTKAEQETARADRLEKELQEAKANEGVLSTQAALEDERSKREEFEVLLSKQVSENEKLRKLLEEAEVRLEDQEKDSVDLDSLKQLLEEEELRRKSAEAIASMRNEQLQDLKKRASGDQDTLQVRDDKIHELEMEVLNMKRQKNEAIKQAKFEVSIKESKMFELQQQLAEELAQRQQAQRQLVEKEQLLKEMREQSLDKPSKQALKDIEKDREVCDLQQQLAEELSKRQAIQYQQLEKDRTICELQAALNALYDPSTSQQETPALMAPALHTIDETDGISPLEQIVLQTTRGQQPADLWMPSGAPRPKLPPWLASPAVLTRTALPLSSRATFAVPSTMNTEIPPWVSGGAVANQIQVISSHPAGAVHVPAGCHTPIAQYRQRAYGMSPSVQYQTSHLPLNIQRRVSSASHTFT